MNSPPHAAAFARERRGPLSAWGTAERDLTWKYLKPHWRRLTAVVAMAFASSGIELVRMGLLLAVIGGSSVSGLPFGLPTMPLNILLSGVVGASIAAAAWDWWRRHVSATIQRDFTEALRADVCRTMLHRSLDWFTANPAGQASYLLNGQVGRFSTLVPMASDGIAAILQGVAVVGLMIHVSPNMTAVSVLWSLALWSALHPLQWRIRRLSVDVSVESGKAAEKAEELAYAIKLIKSCRTEALETDRYAGMASSLAEKQVKLSDLRNLAGGVTLIGFVVILIGIMLFGGMATSAMAGFAALLLRLYPCLTKLVESRTALATMGGHLAAVAEFMAVEGKPSWRGFPYRVLDDDLSAAQLTHSFTGDVAVLNGLQLNIRRGQATALVGLTGSGKSTLLDVLAGLRASDVGAVCWPRTGGVAYLTQEPVIFNASIADNLQYGATTVTERRAVFSSWDAMGRSHVSAKSVSGGERQLVAIERLAMQSAVCWLLDEPTSAMDAETEKTALDWVLHHRKDRIILMATHKLSLAARFDRILVLHQGRIVQDGTHEELVKQDGLYQRLWKLQEIA